MKLNKQERGIIRDTRRTMILSWILKMIFGDEKGCTQMLIEQDKEVIRRIKNGEGL